MESKERGLKEIVEDMEDAMCEITFAMDDLKTAAFVFEKLREELLVLSKKYTK